MPSSSASAFALASSLRSRGDAELVELIRSREVRESGVNDFFDLAERLLERTSIQAALVRLDRRTLLTLAAICELGVDEAAVPFDSVTDRIRQIDQPAPLAFPTTVEVRAARLSSVGLIGTTDVGYVAFDAVRDVLASWPSMGLPSTEELTSPLPSVWVNAGTFDQDPTDALASERAFSASMAIVELLAELSRDGVRELARGGWGQPDLKRLVAATGAPIDAIPLLLRGVQQARLVTNANGKWVPSADASAWAVLPLAKRWARIADAWLDLVPEDLRFVLADRANVAWGEYFMEFLAWMYPAADAAVHENIRLHMATSELFGIIADGSPSSAGSSLLTRGADAGAAAMAALLPPEIDTVYLQHDLSVVSPGPLVPEIDARLRSMATVESRALASTFRISAASITRALAAGDTEETLIAFLSGISLTGIPQPLRYLITETAGRYGMLRVGKVVHPDSHRVSFVRATDGELLATLLVDRRLSPLGLRAESPGVAVSRFDRDVVYLALLDARYPAAAEDENQQIVIVDRRPSVRDPSSSTAAAPRDPATSIVEKLRLSATATASESGTAWLERQLEVAIKSKLSVTVTVTMPDGSLQDYLLEPTGLSKGRLRARDRKADIERTLPLSRIAMVTEG